MRATCLLGGVALVLACAANAPAQNTPYEATIAVPEVEVRCGPSSDPKVYATSKLRQGDRVRVLREEAGGWLAIEPPAGSFSWINARLIEISAQKTSAQVLGDDAPVRIGSELVNAPPTVQQVKLARGAQVVLLDSKKVYTEDGGWLPILPPPQEVRYIPASAVKATPQVQTVQSAPATAEAPGSGEALWQQAQQAEQTGNVAEAERLYLQLARQTADHDLSIRCHNRIHFLRAHNHGSVPPGYQPGRPSEAQYPSAAVSNRLAPMPNAPPYVPPRQGQVTSQYTYQKDAPPPPARPAGSPQPSGPGWLRRAPFWLDQKATYVLESSQGQPRLYVTAQPGVNLEPYVNRNVDLWGPIVYRGDVKTNYMSVMQVKPLP